MSWGDAFNRHKATGMDPSAAAFIADQGEPARKKRADKDEAIRLLSAALDLCIQMMNDNGLHLPHTVEKAREAQSFAGIIPATQTREPIRSALVDVPSVEPEPVAWLKLVKMTPIAGDEYQALWLTDEADAKAFPVYAHPPLSALVDNSHASEAVVETWQPIETAPRDWTDVLLYLPDEDDGTGERGVVKGWFSMKDGGFDCWFGRGINSESNVDPCNPTHWMPLPAPPAFSSLRPAEVGSASTSIGGE